MAMVMIGDELGLYRPLTDREPVTKDEQAGRCGHYTRLVQEWLNNGAASHLEPADGGYRLPPKQATALADQDSPAFAHVDQAQNEDEAVPLVEPLAGGSLAENSTPIGRRCHAAFHHGRRPPTP